MEVSVTTHSIVVLDMDFFTRVGEYKHLAVEKEALGGGG